MDNKQKKKIFKAIHKVATLLILVSIAFSVYLLGNELYVNKYAYNWLNISLIVVNGIFAFTLLYDSFLTKKHKNKYGLAKFNFFIVLVSIIGVMAIFGLTYFEKIVITEVNILAIKLFAINVIAVIFNFYIGLKLSKLYSNTTITIDSISEVPNYDDELALKKKLDDLNRKLEIQKVQQEIKRAEEELDENKN